MLPGFSVRADIRDGLVSHWAFEEVDGDKTPDLISGNHLTLHNMNSANLVPGRHGNAFSFDGTAQFLSLTHADHARLPVYGAKNFTIAMWVKAGPNQTNRILFAEGSTKHPAPLFLLGTHRMGRGGSLNAYVRNTSELLSNVPSQRTAFDNHWHHIAWVDENGAGKLYIDGFRDAVSFRYPRVKMDLNYLSVGGLLRTPPMWLFKGEIDEVAIWERALEEKEIEDLPNATISTLTPTK